MRHIKNPLHRANAQAQREFSFIADGRKYLVRLNLVYAYVYEADVGATEYECLGKVSNRLPAGRLRYPRTTEGASICLREALAGKSNRKKKEQRILEDKNG